MAFMDFFKSSPDNDSGVQKYSSLFNTLKAEFPSVQEDDLLKASCVAGLFARVAYIDFDLDAQEMKKMSSLIEKWSFSGADGKVISQLAIGHIKEMSGLDNHLFVKPLNQLMDKEERFNTVKALFLIAASDGSVDSIESEEIRLITKGLELSTQHFVAARAAVVDFLKTLK